MTPPDTPREPSPDARFRAAYRRAQAQRRLAGVQPDLFGAAPVEHFHRNAPAPKMPMPVRAVRHALTAEEKAAIIAGAANWLKVGQRVRIIATPGSIDGTTERRAGRVGIVWRLCHPPFADYVYVNLDLVGTERSEKIVMIELRDVEPIES